MISHFKCWFQVVLRGLAQVAFAERPIAGVLVLAGIAVLIPASAVGALAGALAGAVAGRLQGTLNRAQWEAGLSVPNPAIVGILWGGASASGDAGILALALAGCIGLEQLFRPVLDKARLPVLSAPAMATIYLVASVYGVFGESFWHGPPTLPFGDAGVAAAILLIGGAMATKSPIATVQVAVLSGAAALISGWATGGAALGLVGLWGFTVAPAAFGVHAVFFAGSAAGAWAGLAAAGLGTAVWVLWLAGPLAAVAPPLLVPFILAVWVMIGLVARTNGLLVLDPGLWAAAGHIRRAHARGRPVVALTGAGISTASGIPDYISGSWLRPDFPASAYSFERFVASAPCRREYWNACDNFRQAADKARPNAAHRALTNMERQGWLAATITQNVDGLHHAAGARSVIALHGEIAHVKCLSCGWTGGWPPSGMWRRYDLHCSECSGYLKPAVISMGENIPPAVWREAEQAVADCGVMIVVGSQMAVSSAVELIASARRAGADIVVISLDPPARSLAPDDLVLSHKAEEALPALALLLDCPDGRRWGMIRRNVASTGTA